jgi:hypothetical protein
METSTQVIDGYSQVVLSAGWRCTGKDVIPPPAGSAETVQPTTYTATNYGSASFPIPATGGSFTPYDQLTQQQVIDWCWHNGVDQTAVEASINSNIDAQLNPTEVQLPLPWVSE